MREQERLRSIHYAMLACNSPDDGAQLCTVVSLCFLMSASTHAGLSAEAVADFQTRLSDPAQPRVAHGLAFANRKDASAHKHAGAKSDSPRRASSSLGESKCRQLGGGVPVLLLPAQSHLWTLVQEGGEGAVGTQRECRDVTGWGTAARGEEGLLMVWLPEAPATADSSGP